MQAQSAGLIPSTGSSKKRNIAAPFQPQQPQQAQQSRRSGSGKNILLPDLVQQQYSVDFRNHSFTPLTPLNQLRYEHYVGPTNESNWVIPGILLVGAYPASQDDIETFELITSILKLGVRKFVCLQQEYRPGVPEGMWREGLALRPYFEDVQHIVANKGLIPALRDHKIVDYENLSFEHCPIIDCGITDDSKVLELARKLVNDISVGEVIYLHCWGGHGRTGTVVSIMLHIMYGLNPYEAMERCQAVHDLRRCRVEVGSPQTQTQRDQVIRIVNGMMRSYREAPPGPRAPSPSMLTRVMSPASSALKKLFGRSSPSGSAQNSATNILNVPGIASVQDAVTHADDDDAPAKENAVQPAASTNGESSPPKSLTFSVTTKKEDGESVSNSPAFLKDTPKTVSTEASDISIGVVDTAPITVTSPVTPMKESPATTMTPVLATPIASKSLSMTRQSTEKLKNCLSNPSSPEPNLSELDDHVKNQSASNSPLATLVASLSKSKIPVAGEVLSPAGAADLVVTKEVLNLQTGGSFTVQRSRQSSGSDAFLSPMRDEAVNGDHSFALDRDHSLGIKLVASADSYDDHHIPVLMTTEHIDGDLIVPPSFRASTAGDVAVGPLDGDTMEPEGGRITRAASATVVGPGQFSRQPSMSRKETPINSAPMSRRGSINGFMEPVNASSVAPPVGPGQFSRQSSFKRNEIGTLSRRGSMGGGEFPPAGRFSRQPSLKREVMQVEIATAIAEIQAAGSTDSAVVFPSNPPSRRGSFTTGELGVRSTVASARLEIGESPTLLNRTLSPAPSAVTTLNNGVALSPLTPTAPTTPAPASEEKRRPVPPLLSKSPSGRTFGGVAQSAGRKLETVASPSTPTDSPSSQAAER